LDPIGARPDDGNDSSVEASMAKTFSFAVVHFSVAFAVGYLMTGSMLIGARWRWSSLRATRSHSTSTRSSGSASVVAGAYRQPCRTTT
jgi:hypothetical protein